VNTIADAIIRGDPDNYKVSDSIDSYKYQQLGEEAMKEKLNKILDEVSKERQEFEESIGVS
jgi:hypothetical protein